MKLFLQRLTHFNARSVSIPLTPGREILTKITARLNPRDTSLISGQQNTLSWKNKITRLSRKIAQFPFMDKAFQARKAILAFMQGIKSIGFTDNMEEYTKRKLGVFNLLNFFQLLTGLMVPIAGALTDDKLTTFSWYMSSLPAFISVLVLSLNSMHKYEIARIGYFLLYPFFTSIVYMGGMNLGGELYFILYGILSVFFIQEISNMLFSVALSMISYFVLAVVLDNFQYQLHTENFALYIWNQIIAIIFIFYGLFLIKKESAGYQENILAKNLTLQNKNIEIRRQKKEIAEKAIILKRQAAELTELNALKSKLFSVIAHDLKSPMYALQNLFRNIQNYDMPGEEIREMIPDVVNDLNYTTGLMENLLEWAKTQMKADLVRMQPLDAYKMISDNVKLLMIQAEAKKITIEIQSEIDIYVLGDRDMINLVLRNLLSNAIKFTNPEGHIVIGTEEKAEGVQFFVHDSGVGISQMAIQKLKENDYYSTKGTASESGTGLGLMLCKEFIGKNGSKLDIESFPKRGSIFSFLLKREEEDKKFSLLAV